MSVIKVQRGGDTSGIFHVAASGTEDIAGTEHIALGVTALMDKETIILPSNRI